MKNGIINRYTSFASAIDLLANKQITLLDPNSWDDKNDVHFMARYKEIVNAKSVFALCLSKSKQSYHHWRVFAGGQDGVCITFFEDHFRRAFSDDPRVEIQDIEYLSMPDARKRKPLSEHNLKFLKHARYRAEQETRVVFTDKNRQVPFPKYEISLNAIQRITLSPWLSKPLVQPMKDLMKKVDGCHELHVYSSTLVQYRDWQNLAPKDAET